MSDKFSITALDYTAPDGAWDLICVGFYKDFAPTALEGDGRNSDHFEIRAVQIIL